MANLGRYFCATNLSKTSYFRHVPILQGFELSLGKFCLNIFPQNSYGQISNYFSNVTIVTQNIRQWYFFRKIATLPNEILCSKVRHVPRAYAVDRCVFRILPFGNRLRASGLCHHQG